MSCAKTLKGVAMKLKFAAVLAALAAVCACTSYIGVSVDRDKNVYLTYTKGFIFYSNGVYKCIQYSQNLTCADMDINRVDQLEFPESSSEAAPEVRTTRSIAVENDALSENTSVSRKSVSSAPSGRSNTASQSAAPPPAPDIKNIKIIELGHSENIGAAMEILANWVGLDVVAEMKDGTSERGRLGGVNGLTVVIAKSDGASFIGSLVDMKRISRH